jgi:hypothetical protein
MSESGKFYVAFLIIAFVACNQDFEAPKHHRVRRFLQFQNISRILVSTTLSVDKFRSFKNGNFVAVSYKCERQHSEG